MHPDKNLDRIAQELRIIARQAQRVEAADGESYERIDEIGLAVESAFRALAAYECGERAEGQGEALTGGLLVTTYEYISQ